MTSVNSPTGKLLRPYSYDNFQGLDTSRDIASLDTGENQHLAVLNNGYSSFRGIILRDRGYAPRTTSPGDRLIKHINFYGRDLVAWAQVDGGGITLKSEPNNIELKEVYPSTAVVTSTIFNNRIIFFSQNEPMYIYDGLKFEESENKTERPAFGVAIQRRLAISGGNDRRTVVDLSQVDNEEIFTRDEEETNTAVTRAADIDVKNIIGTSDEITGLGVFEKSKLAVFTNDQTIIYSISPDFNQFQIDDKASIGVGCLSHNSIANVGTDLLFCSRSGVHSLRRSETNGITIYAVPLSSKIEEMYKELVRSVKDPRDISAFYDRDNGQYHVFFPQTDIQSKRLTLTISPSPDATNKWSTGDYLNPRCGASLGGTTCVGTAGGIFNSLEYEEDGVTNLPELEVDTPILWHDSLTETKHSAQIILQASGQGQIEITAFNNEGKQLQVIKIDLDNDENEDDNYTFLPLSRQYSRQFRHQYKGVRFKIKTTGGQGRIKIIGLAVLIEQERRERR